MQIPSTATLICLGYECQYMAYRFIILLIFRKRPGKGSMGSVLMTLVNLFLKEIQSAEKKWPIGQTVWSRTYTSS